MKNTYLRSLGVLTLLCQTCTWAFAQESEWTQVFASGTILHYVQPSSIVINSAEPTEISFRWRNKDSRFEHDYESVANCRQFTLTNIKSRIKWTSGSELQIDYATDPLFKGKRVSYAAFGGGVESQLIEYVCRRWLPSEIAKITDSSKGDCNKATSPIDVILCRRNDTITANFKLFSDRVFQAQTACAETEERMKEVFIDGIMGAYLCETDKCASDGIAASLGILNDDMARLQEHAAKSNPPLQQKVCRAADIVLKKKMDQAAEQQSKLAFSDYWRCIRAAIPKLDDARSNPDAVAQGIHAACLSIFNHALELRPNGGNLTASATFYSAFQPQIILLILKHRAPKKEPQKKIQPKTVM